MILSPQPSAPSSFKVIVEPNIGLYVSQSIDDKDYSFVLIDGQQWAIKNKEIKHYRNNNVSKINSRITIMEGSLAKSIIVVGSPEELRKKLNKRQLLRD